MQHRTTWAALALILFGLGSGALIYKYKWRINQIYKKTFVYPPLSPSELGDGGHAGNLTLFHPGGILRGSDGIIYLADRGEVTGGRPFQGSVIWKIDKDGIARAIAGTGRRDKLPGDITALQADLRSVETMRFDPAGRLTFVDHKYGIVWRIEPNGRLKRIAGTGKRGYEGDGGPALKATFNKPYDIVFDATGNMYVADAENHAVRKIATDGTISTFAGTGKAGYTGDGGPARKARLNKPYNLAIDAENGLLIGDSENHVVRRVDALGTIETIAGSGRAGYSGDGKLAREAQLDGPQFMAVAAGRLYIGDEHNHAIRVVDTDGIISTIIGRGKAGFARDGTPSKEARINDPEGFLVEPDGTLLVLDSRNHRVLRIGPKGRIQNFAGRGLPTRQLEAGPRS